MRVSLPAGLTADPGLDPDGIITLGESRKPCFPGHALKRDLLDERVVDINLHAVRHGVAGYVQAVAHKHLAGGGALCGNGEKHRAFVQRIGQLRISPYRAVEGDAVAAVGYFQLHARRAGHVHIQQAYVRDGERAACLYKLEAAAVVEIYIGYDFRIAPGLSGLPRPT